MKLIRYFLAAALLLAGTQLASAQSAVKICDNAGINCAAITASGQLQTTGTGGGGGGDASSDNQTSVQGPATPGAPTATKGNLSDGTYNATPPTFLDGQQGSIQLDNHGAAKNCWVDLTGACTDPSGAVAVLSEATSASAAGIVPAVTSAVASNLVVKGAPGNLYRFHVTAGASAGFVLTFNATSAPADGAVTPVGCYAVAANSTLIVDMSPGPARYFSTGIVIVFSTTGCFTKTASATAFISGDGV